MTKRMQGEGQTTREVYTLAMSVFAVSAAMAAFARYFLPRFAVMLSDEGDGGKGFVVRNTAAAPEAVESRNTAVSDHVSNAVIAGRNVRSLSYLPLTSGAGMVQFCILALLLTGVSGCPDEFGCCHAPSLQGTGPCARLL